MSSEAANIRVACLKTSCHPDDAERCRPSRSMTEKKLGFPQTSYLIYPISLNSPTIVNFGPLSGETSTSLASGYITPSRADPTNVLAGTHEPEFPLARPVERLDASTSWVKGWGWRSFCSLAFRSPTDREMNSVGN
ncbi:uncharacterized protein N7496_012285 [Penicillium cataractarum]|uniref:Uncharacterized protein n=1 Tax=Penicillium cataractarum TaxID=2100454 RepID=A0A9W9URQ8_9EURO|nr:uncharacterized protein N7496_012285 [Penicillium cataractarum]KAJ5355073.1 hypothetical protein N7496_012285 [Penicillium cataractarum]